MKITQCESCGSFVKSYDTINLSSKNKTRVLCSKCYNETVSEYQGLDFQHVTFDPVTIKDSDGVPHTFDFRTNLFGDKVFIEALEIKEGKPSGYNFTAYGEAEDDILKIFKKLFEHLRRALSQKHIEEGDFTRYRITDNDLVRGRIEWDDNEDGRVPCLVIDGKYLSWEEFGKMLMSYEGFHFKLEIFERSEER